MTWDEFQQGVSDLYKEEQGKEKIKPRSCSVCHQDCTHENYSSYFCMDCWATQGEDKVKIARLQQDLDQWAKNGTCYFDEIVALKRERTELKNERDTWRARHQALKSAIGTATQASSLDAATYG